jgi:DNA-directed RNA polymerase subunit RPC12/RpoP
VRKCGYCGGSKLKRVHRTFLERFSYLAIYECRECENEEFIPRRYTYHFAGEEARCPNCGTYRVTKLRGVDKIDKMASGPLNRLEKLMGGNLYHCVFCRLQFYDRRKAAPRTFLEPIPPTVEAQAVPAPPAQAALPITPPETELAAAPERANSDQ